MLPSVDYVKVVSKDETSKSYECEHCKLSFSGESDLRKHEEISSALLNTLKEMEKKDLVCKVCKQVFQTHRGMRQHYGKLHGQTKKIKCKSCSKRFKDNYALKYHRKQVHEKSTQVQCYLCMKLIYNRFSFKKHISECSKRFFQPQVMDIISQ